MENEMSDDMSINGLYNYLTYCTRKKEKADIKKEEARLFLASRVGGMGLHHTKLRLQVEQALLAWRFWANECRKTDHLIQECNLDAGSEVGDSPKIPMNVEFLETLKFWECLSEEQQEELRGLMWCFRAAPTYIYDDFSFSCYWNTKEGYTIGFKYYLVRNNPRDRWIIWEDIKGEKITICQSPEHLLIKPNRCCLKVIQVKIDEKLSGYHILPPCGW
jgi:hypothetical protein